MDQQEVVVYRKALICSYDGTNFHGWQVQPGHHHTVQRLLESNLSKVCGQPIEIVGCGRTDSGVHAKQYVAHFDTKSEVENATLIYKLNKMCGSDIAIHNIVDVAPNFHARYDAIARSYTYRMRTVKNPFDNRFTFKYPYADAIDLNVLNKVAHLISRYQDFHTFCKTKTDVNHTLCEIYQSKWSYDDTEEVYLFSITANRYLRGMIRLIVGACLNVNRGQVSLDELAYCLNHKERLPKDWSVPACGLTLHDIRYPQELQLYSTL